MAGMIASQLERSVKTLALRLARGPARCFCMYRGPRLIFRELRADAMNAENRHRRDEREFLEDFDRETARLLGDADHAIGIMERLGDQEYRARHGGHAKGGAGIG